MQPEADPGDSSGWGQTLCNMLLPEMLTACDLGQTPCPPLLEGCEPYSGDPVGLEPPEHRL